VVAAAIALGGCSIAAESLDPAAIPSGSFQVAGDQPTGPIVELGTGVSAGIGWRYLIYPVGDTWCGLLETGRVAGGGCGDLLAAEGEVFGSVGTGLVLEEPVTPVDGFVSEDVASVWLVLEEVDRVPAIVMPLDEAGLEGSAFVGIVPDDRTITHLLAVAQNGEVLETYELP
jgi:hypothetical protein